MHYESSRKVLGLPLVHIAIGPSEGTFEDRGIARGWIAIGDIAFGVVFALGGVAVGAVSLGGLSLGVLAVAGLSLGVWSFGGLAIGVHALGGVALAAWAAYGGVAVAWEYAAGGVAIAEHANTDVAQAYFGSSAFFGVGEQAARHSRWLPLFLVLTPIFVFLAKRRAARVV